MKNFLIKSRFFSLSGVFGLILFLFISFITFNFFFPQKFKTLKIFSFLKVLDFWVISVFFY